MDTFSTLKLDIDGRVGRITLARPEKLNPLGSDALVELKAAAEAVNDAGADVVVVTGEGRAFSGGFDLRELAANVEDEDAPGDHAERTATLGADMVAAVQAIEGVTIAAIPGPAVGGGFVLAMTCDLRLASEDAWLSLPEAELGMPLGWSGVPLLVRQLGSARALELILTTRRISANEAADWGILNGVVAQPDLEDEVERYVAKFLELRPIVLRLTKRQVRVAAEEIVATTGLFVGTDELVAAALASDARSAADSDDRDNEAAK